MAPRRRRPSVVAKIPSRPTPAPGALGREHLAAYDGLLARTAGSRAVLIGGAAEARAPVAIGLAAAAAAGERRTALVECDLDAPGLAARLDLAETPGLAEYLRDEAEPAEILQPLLVAGPDENPAREPLVCIVAGERGEAGAAELLSTDAFGHVIAKLRSAYDMVVVEGPAFTDREALVAALRHVDLSLAAGTDGLSREMRDHIDGIVEQAP